LAQVVEVVARHFEFKAVSFNSPFEEILSFQAIFKISG
jgi:hypothetical protein